MNLFLEVTVRFFWREKLAYSFVGELVEVERAPASNSISMVAWKMTLYTPEYPSGRLIYVVANDITHQIGSFGTDVKILKIVFLVS